MIVRENRIIQTLIVVFVLVTTAPTFAGKIIYVDDDAAPLGDGASWETAFTYLQDALADANSSPKPVEIRVAQGIYTPDRGAGITPGDREATFQLINGVTLKGSYAGCGEPNPDARDVELYETILSGDLNGNDVDVKDPRDLLSEPTRSENSYHVVTASGTDETSVLDGFYIIAGNAFGPWGTVRANGGGILNEGGKLKISNCTISGNSAYRYGGGIDNLSDSSPILINCAFTKNRANYGGGICNSSNSRPILINCIFNGNTASRGAGMYDNSNSELVNCILVANRDSRWGGGIYKEAGNISLTNCTLAGNSTRRGWGGGIYKEEGNITLTNCILWCNFDESGSGELAQIYGEAPVINYCCIKGWTGVLGGTGNIGDDPMFINADGYSNFSGTENYDLSLLRSSPCIGAGNNTFIPNDIADLDGDGDINEPIPYDVDGGARVIDVVDIGAYEGARQGFLLSNKSVIVPEGETASFTVELSIEPLSTVEVSVFRESGDTDITVKSGTPLTFDSSNYLIPQIVTLAAAEDKDSIYGIAKFKIKGNGLVTKEIISIEQDNEYVANILFIDQYYGDNGNDGLSKETAFGTIQWGVDSAADGDVVLVADGIYHSKGLNDPVLDFCGKAITVRSENGPENCILYTGDYVVSFQSGETPASVLSGFTVTGADPGAGICCWDSSPTIMNNIITYNWSEYGLGSVLLHNSSARVIGNVITANQVYGPCAGIYVCHGSSVTITNNTIVGNGGDGGWYGNGGVHCTEDGTATITNCIFWNNGDYDLYGCSATYSCLEHEHSGTGNIHSDPAFVNPGHWENYSWVDFDYHLLAGSPCIDMGDPKYVTGPGETDLDGRPRIIGERIDMGAYEFPISAEARILPQTINLASKGNWITCYIWLPEEYDVADIDPNSIFLENKIQPEQFLLNEDQKVALAKFDRDKVQAILDVGEIELTITGRLTNGTVFEATDIIKVTDKAGK